jgi:hypothetical protein
MNDDGYAGKTDAEIMDRVATFRVGDKVFGTSRLRRKKQHWTIIHREEFVIVGENDQGKQFFLDAFRIKKEQP